MAVVATALVILAPTLISFFDPTPEVVAFGTECVRIVSLSMIFSAVGVVLARGFDGAGNTVPAMTINLVSFWVLEIPLAFALSRLAGLGALGVWWGRAISNIANGLLFVIWFWRGKWKERQV